jgi:N-acetylmuramic acid 6-phosphate etherase
MDFPEEVPRRIRKLKQVWTDLDTEFIVPYIQTESDCYRNDEFLLYETDETYGISILTDTTERAPTFSLLPFENSNTSQSPSWCYLFFPHAENSADAWEKLLHRSPRTLEWEGIDGVASRKRLLGFDFSSQLPENRRRLTGGIPHHRFKIHRCEQGISFELENLHHEINTSDLDSLSEHLLLKLVLNTHSTLVMGKMGRYEGNVMTWVRASNYKLIDRTIRYVSQLLQRQGIHEDYSKIAGRCFEKMASINEDQPLVLLVVDEFLNQTDPE